MTTPIPDFAPYSADQRAWLSGFFAGLNSRLVAAAVGGGGAAAASTRALDVLYGSQTGNAEELASDTAGNASASGLAGRVAALDDVSLDALAGMRRLLVVTSTYGEGEMPDNAQLFWEALNAPDAPRLEGLSFAVLALGDSSYDGYCQAGKLIDLRLEQLGATRVIDRIDLDVDYEDAAAAWLVDAVAGLAAVVGDDETDAPAATLGTSGAEAKAKHPKSKWTRKNPYESTISGNRRLSGERSAKEIRHLEFDLGDSGIEYAAGDALGVLPSNDPALVELVVERLGVDGETEFAKGRGVREALTDGFEIVTPPRELVALVEERAKNDELSHVFHVADKEALASWLWGRDVLDLLDLAADAGSPISVAELADVLRPLQHRAYSISSSPLAHPGQVHLTTATVRYPGAGRAGSLGGRMRGGVASTFLADRTNTARIFASPNTAFRPPADDTVPMIMVGPGTGVAPFRAFLEERRERGATGQNWLFFGDQHRESDFVYEDELGAMSRDGLLTRLDLAFSRDQAEKIYVQTRMRENGRELYDWLERGGTFYVCGDAGRMAKDVDQALHEVIAQHGAHGDDGAVEYVNTLKREKRYLRDVY